MIEIKEYVKLDVMTEEVNNMFIKYDLYNRTTVASFSPIILYLIRKKNPKIVTQIVC
jgi:hypothetical protein